VPTAGEYGFSTESDDGSMLYVGGTLVVDNDHNHAMTAKGGALELSAGGHGLIYDSTFSRNVWRLYGGAKGIVMWY
jgi:hypothetical protein